MEIQEFNKRPSIESNKKLANKYVNFEKMMNELRKKEIPSEIVNSINQDIEEINSFSGSDAALLKLLRKTQSNLLKLIEKELHLVTKNHYRNMWLAVGMSAFGIPFGVVFGVSLGNMAFIGIGLPIGMAIGIGIGIAKDKKAFENGNQLDVEIKH